MSTQKKVWLVGSPIPTIPGQKLPSKEEVLKYLFNLHLQKGLSLNQSISWTAVFVTKILNVEGIPTKQ